MITANHPKASIGFQHTPDFLEPTQCEFIVSGKIAELIPVVIDPIDFGIIRTPQLAAELQIVRRVGENGINRLGGQFRQNAQAVADKNTIERQDSRWFYRAWHGCEIYPQGV